MALNLEEWEEVLNALGFDSKVNIIEEIAGKLEGKDKGEYEKWERAGFDVNYQFEYGVEPTRIGKMTLLHFAALSRNVWGVKALIENGANINAVNENENTPLHLAISRNEKIITSNLLRAEEIDVNAQNRDGNTPLHLAILENAGGIVQLLLSEKEIDVNKVNNDSHTPLRLATTKCNGCIAQALIEHEFDLRGPNTPKPEYLVQCDSDFERKMSKCWDRIKKLNEKLTIEIPNKQKSKWPTVVISTLAVAALTISATLVAHFVFQASLLATGITAGVGACCLVAAATIYYCNKPSKSLENSNAERVNPEEIKTSCCA